MAKPFVFVSSVVRGMEGTRSLIKSFLQEKIGYDVVISESEGSKGRAPIDQCKKWASECDIYICILSERYGDVIKRLGVSVTEMEFNEARKDNPEKILIYISEGNKEPRQEEFVRRIGDFAEGYYRRKPFEDDSELINGIKEDLANLMKERLDVIRTQRLKIKPALTPSAGDYVTADLRKRALRMIRDATEVASSLGLKRVQLLRPMIDIMREANEILRTSGAKPLELPVRDEFEEFLFTECQLSFINCEKNIGEIDTVLLTIWVLPSSLTQKCMSHYTKLFQLHIYYHPRYQNYPNRFTIFLVNGDTRTRSLESHIRGIGGLTSFYVEPGLYFGVGLDLEPGRNGIRHIYENILFLSRVRNKEIMMSKLSEALGWIEQMSHRIDFQCNFFKP